MNQEGGGLIPDYFKERFNIVDDYDPKNETRPMIASEYIKDETAELIKIVKQKTLIILREYLRKLEIGTDKELSDDNIFIELKRLDPPFIKKELIYVIRYILNIEAEIIKQNSHYEKLNSKRNKTREDLKKKYSIDLRLSTLKESYGILVEDMVKGDLSSSMSKVFGDMNPPYSETNYPDQTLNSQFKELISKLSISPGKRNTRKSRRRYEKSEKTRRTRRQKH